MNHPRMRVARPQKIPLHQQSRGGRDDAIRFVRPPLSGIAVCVSIQRGGLYCVASQFIDLVEHGVGRRKRRVAGDVGVLNFPGRQGPLAGSRAGEGNCYEAAPAKNRTKDMSKKEQRDVHRNTRRERRREGRGDINTPCIYAAPCVGVQPSMSR